MKSQSLEYFSTSTASPSIFNSNSNTPTHSNTTSTPSNPTPLTFSEPFETQLPASSNLFPSFSLTNPPSTTTSPPPSTHAVKLSFHSLKLSRTPTPYPNSSTSSSSTCTASSFSSSSWFRRFKRRWMSSSNATTPTAFNRTVPTPPPLKFERTPTPYPTHSSCWPFTRKSSSSFKALPLHSKHSQKSIRPTIRHLTPISSSSEQPPVLTIVEPISTSVMRPSKLTKDSGWHEPDSAAITAATSSSSSCD
ncbi:hypothetical protein HMI54_014607 [Coelomomyces lativittatus]|nr:hypothetical protein HMI55_000253 [Coelomomyces lativittatus]KAJ1513921.1 hypothetical protein HMI54_014607 [Coelomomyces lativittatus]KAJ1514063.1 hypothetical protein HMI56_001232 [Coelomomyces lativittatus]